MTLTPSNIPSIAARLLSREEAMALPRSPHGEPRDAQEVSCLGATPSPTVIARP
jgi:hypothetical protein